MSRSDIHKHKTPLSCSHQKTDEKKDPKVGCPNIWENIHRKLMLLTALNILRPDKYKYKCMVNTLQFFFFDTLIFLISFTFFKNIFMLLLFFFLHFFFFNLFFVGKQRQSNTDREADDFCHHSYCTPCFEKQQIPKTCASNTIQTKPEKFLINMLMIMFMFSVSQNYCWHSAT